MPFSFLSRFALIAALFLSFRAEATHIIGAEISYTPHATQLRRYEVTAKLYRDRHVNGPDFGYTISLYCHLNTCSATAATNVSFQLPRTSISPTGYTQCFSNSTVETQVYTASIVLPSAGNWTLNIAETYRNSGIWNLPNSGLYKLYVDAELTIDPANVVPNTSPVFTSSILPYISGNQPHRFSFSAYDADGDSLVYRMITPRTAINSDFCAQDLPMLPTQHFTLDPARGELASVPFTLYRGSCIMAARVEEYRRISGNWRKIGSVMRDVMYPVFVGAGNWNPSFTSASVGNTTQPVGQVLRVVPGQTITIQLAATDQDAGQVLRFSTAATVPGVSFRSISATQAQLTWQVPTDLPLGRYSIPVVVQDTGCPINGSDSQTLNFLVTTRVLSATTSWLPTPASAFPSPFHEQVQFQLTQPTTQFVTIVDGLGRTVAQLTSRPDGSVLWRPSPTLAPGLYLARTADGQQPVRLLHE
jgi:hypothetical protein